MVRMMTVSTMKASRTPTTTMPIRQLDLDPGPVANWLTEIEGVEGTSSSEGSKISYSTGVFREVEVKRLTSAFDRYSLLPVAGMV